MEFRNKRDDYIRSHEYTIKVQLECYASMNDWIKREGKWDHEENDQRETCLMDKDRRKGNEKRKRIS